jgi:hypothetical protein
MEFRFTQGYVDAWSVMESNFPLYSSDKERFREAVKAKYPNVSDDDIDYAFYIAQRILERTKQST